VCPPGAWPVGSLTRTNQRDHEDQPYRQRPRADQCERAPWPAGSGSRPSTVRAEPGKRLSLPAHGDLVAAHWTVARRRKGNRKQLNRTRGSSGGAWASEEEASRNGVAPECESPRNGGKRSASILCMMYTIESFTRSIDRIGRPCLSSSRVSSGAVDDAMPRGPDRLSSHPFLYMRGSLSHPLTQYGPITKSAFPGIESQGS